MTITDQIASGVFDNELADIEKAVEARLLLVRKSRAASEYGIGDVVKFNTFCGTKYLHGHKATVVGVRGKKLIVKLATPMGRFARVVDGEIVSSEISVPPSIVDLVK